MRGQPKAELNSWYFNIRSIWKSWRSANKPFLGRQKWRKWCAGEVKPPERDDRVRARSQPGSSGLLPASVHPVFHPARGKWKKWFHNPLSWGWARCRSCGQSHLFKQLDLRTPQKLLKSHSLSFLKGVKSCIQTKQGWLLPHWILSADQDLPPSSQWGLL